MRPLTVAAFVILLSSCDSKPPVAPVPKPVALPPLTSEARRFSKVNLINTVIVEKQLLGKPFMPGGTLAQYKKGKTEYDMFVGKVASAGDAALILPDWRKTLTDPKLVPSFGGYYGLDAGRPVFVFTKGAWIAGIAGLPQKEADAEARKLAGKLD